MQGANFTILFFLLGARLKLEEKKTEEKNKEVLI